MQEVPLAKETLLHRYYICCKNCEIDSPVIAETEHLAVEVCELGEERLKAEICFWGRGLVPLEWVTPEEEPRQWHWEFGSHECVDPQQVIVVSDGSGDRYGREPRLRRTA